MRERIEKRKTKRKNGVGKKGKDKKKGSRNQTCHAIRRSLSHDQLYQRLRLYANGRRLISIMSINLFFFFLFLLFERWPTSLVSRSPSLVHVDKDARKMIRYTIPRYDRVISWTVVKFNWCSRECKFSP